MAKTPMSKKQNVKVRIRARTTVFKVKSVKEFSPNAHLGFNWTRFTRTVAAVSALSLVLGLASNGLFAEAANPAVNLDQARNGTASSPNDPVAWVNGNLGSSNSHYVEGQSTAYRAIFTGLTSGSSYTLEVGFDIKSGGKHAIDFLTKVRRINEQVNPCDGISGSCVAGPGFDTPTPPASTPNTQTYFNNLESAEGNQQFSVYNGNITTASYTAAGNENAGGSSEAKVSITFTASASTAVLAWGGHIAREFDWGTGQGATAISGSPYHMRLKSFSAGNVGNQDRSMSAGAVLIGNLTVIKHVINDSGSGSNQAADFTMTVSGVNPSQTTFPGSENGTTINLDPGSYTVDEQTVSGYTKTLGSGCSGSISAGQVVSCTITNDDSNPTTGTLTVIKTVTNDSGGGATPGSFTIHVKSGSTDVAGSPQAGSAQGTVYTLSGGPYTVSEDAVSGYTGDLSQCGSNGSVTVVNGQNVNCTIANNDAAAHLTVIKHVENDNNGDQLASDFTISVTGTDVSDSSFPGDEAGTEVTLDAGSYSVGETGPAGYQPSFSADCSGTIALGASKTCTITNDDIQPLLTVTKIVNGGSKSASEFALSVDSTSVTSGAANGFDAGVYVVSEIPDPDYIGVIGGDCDPGGNVTLNPGDEKECTITNTIKQGGITIIKQTNPQETQEQFTFDPSWSTDDITLGSGGFINIPLDPGNYSVSEINIPEGWDLTSSSCIDEGDNQVNPDSIVLNPDGSVVCTFVNTQRGHLIVNKVTDPQESETSFTINTSGDGTIFGDSSAVISSFSSADFEVEPGTYSVTEDPQEGWMEVGNTCDEVSVGAGETVECTITNIELGRMPITKLVNGDETTSQFTLNAYLTDGGGNPVGFPGSPIGSLTGPPFPELTVPPGVYAVCEMGLGSDTSGLPAGDTTEWTIGGDPVTPYFPDSEANIPCGNATISSGQTTEIVINNLPAPDTFRLTITKTGEGNGTVTGSTSGQEGDETLCDLDECRETDEVREYKQTYGANTEITLNANSDENSNFEGSWSSTPSACSGSNPVCIFTLTGNTIINAHFSANSTPPPPPPSCTSNCGGGGGPIYTGLISGVVFEDTNGNGSQDGSEPILPGWTVFLDTNGNGTQDSGEPYRISDAGGAFAFNSLAPGTYTVREILQTGWSQTTPNGVGGGYTVTVNNNSVSGNIFGNNRPGQVLGVATPTPSPQVAGATLPRTGLPAGALLLTLLGLVPLLKRKNQ